MMMKRRTLILSALLGTSAAWAQPQGIELAGVRHPPTMTVGGKELLLNGAGIRYKFVVKVYAAGLYLGARASTPAAVLASPGPRRLHVTMLRAIDANELGRLFTRGLQDNAPKDEFSRLIPGTLRMSEIFSAHKKLAAGDNFSIDWLPGAGTVILVNGQPQGEAVKEPEFYNALLRIWLGPNPADWLLKDALLGRAAASGSGGGQ